MSAKTILQLRAFYRLCGECGQHPALINRRGTVKRDDRYDLCFRCFRSLNSQIRAAELRAPQSVTSCRF